MTITLPALPQTTTVEERNTQERAAYVEALRTVADLLEGDTSLPVPFTGRLQAGFFEAVNREDGTRHTATQAEKFALLRRFADTLGVDVVEDDDLSRTATLRVGPVSYFAHVNAARVERVRASRVVPAHEDETGDAQ